MKNLVDLEPSSTPKEDLIFTQQHLVLFLFLTPKREISRSIILRCTNRDLKGLSGMYVIFLINHFFSGKDAVSICRSRDGYKNFPMHALHSKNTKIIQGMLLAVVASPNNKELKMIKDLTIKLLGCIIRPTKL